jgi:cyanophycinase
MEKTTGPRPIYLLAGGRGSRRSERDNLLAPILLSAGIPHPSIAYIGAASGDNQPFFMMMSGYLRECGAGKVTLAPLAGWRIKLDKTRAILESADMILVSGGDVEEGMEILKEQRILPFLRELYESGKAFFGVSAGSIMLAKHWVLWDDPNDDSTASIYPCMGLAEILCDTHGEDESWEELRVLLRLSPEGTAGYGIPSGAGLCVHPNGTPEAFGAPVHCFSNSSGKVARCPDLKPQK